ncbi:DUF1104 domain-containing protein [Thermithiobacillus tepidarius DSM 3134]|uniref:DUF1104 domain-containing protein n=1 Tax=Thermithiobacillus tepidarius TaxID=929 RepID=UPI0003FC983D|nr:DUF1104 domain-containing protein [Thermithiobacillus tepidarius]
MKKTALLTLMLGSTLALSTAWAADYRSMSTEELANMRGQVQTLPQTERNAFQQEWQNRVRSMSQEEQRRYLNFGGYSTDEMARMRARMLDAPAAERNAFQQEWQQRLRSMTPEEQQKYLGRPQNATPGQGGMMPGPGNMAPGQGGMMQPGSGGFQGPGMGGGMGSGPRGGRR